eukprot:1225964-Prymnesium_polylepis.1
MPAHAPCDPKHVSLPLCVRAPAALGLRCPRETLAQQHPDRDGGVAMAARGGEGGGRGKGGGRAADVHLYSRRVRLLRTERGRGG